MKNRLFFTTLFSLFCLAFIGQNTVQEQPEVAIQVVRGGDLIPGMDNSLKIVAENLPCETIFVKTDSIQVTRNGCDFKVRPVSQGSLLLHLYQLQNQDTIFFKSQYLRVRNLEQPTAMIGKQSDGKMKAAELKVQQGVRAKIFDNRLLSNHIPIKIHQYRVLVIRPEEGMEEKVIGTVQNEGARFEEHSRDLLKQIQAGDRVYFLDIYYKSWDERIKELVALNTIVLEVG